MKRLLNDSANLLRRPVESKAHSGCSRLSEVVVRLFARNQKADIVTCKQFLPAVHLQWGGS
jgi:hypothetical protein